MYVEDFKLSNDYLFITLAFFSAELLSVKATCVSFSRR